MSKITKTPAKKTALIPATKAHSDQAGGPPLEIAEPAYQDIDRLDQAQALPEIGPDEPRQNAKTTIQVFKGLDRRNMRVVVSDGVLYQQEI